MNVHIILEDDCVDLRLKKLDLKILLEQYPSFKETSLEDAEYLIIIPNYPMAGKQDFRTSLNNLIYEQTDNISEGKILLLDCDNTFFILDESSSHYKEKITYFLDKNVEITQNMFDALVSLGFNIGITGLRESLPIFLLKRNDHKSAAESIKKTKIFTKFPGLAKRRQQEYELFKKNIDNES